MNMNRLYVKWEELQLPIIKILNDQSGIVRAAKSHTDFLDIF